MPKILAITEAMHGNAKNILAKAGEIQSSHSEMERIANGMTPYFSGTLPELLTLRLLDMKKKHEALYEKISQYTEKIDYAADNYDWTDQEIANWTKNLPGGNAQSGNADWTNSSQGSSVGATTPADLSSDNYYSIEPKNPNPTEIMPGGGKGKNPLPYREYDYDIEKDGTTVRIKTGRMNCTFYAYGRAMEKAGVELTGLTGNGGDWLNQAEDNGLSTSRDVTKIQSNSVAVFGKGGQKGEGHVAFIEEVFVKDGVKYISVSEGNGGSRSKDGEIITKTYEEFLKQWGTPEGYIYTS
ncbi:MAG: CHAP domain-containing protein [Synergistaceae bacterium]|jgi:surface antigen/uncharacterized protein YukE|nr:CHAP domain-containing protein [Synergistaceae bacterium]